MPKHSSQPSRRTLFWRELIARHAASKLSVEQFCQQADVSTAAFYSWRKRLGATPDKSSGAANRSVRSAARSAAKRAARPTLVPLRVVGGGSITIEVAQPIRVLVPPGCDEESLRVAIAAALRADEGRASC